MGRTKKVWATGKYGVRYGKNIKQKVIDVERVQKQAHICPNCSRPKIKRLSSGIWTCRLCGIKFAGKAYKP